MSNIGPIASIRVKTQVIGNCWEYVLANFGNFTTQNKIKVALAIISKDMPTQLVGDIGGGTKVIIVKDKQPNESNSRSLTLPEEVS